MSRTTRHWIAFGVVAGAGILLGIVINFFATRPVQAVGILLFAWVLGIGYSGRGPWPFNATIKKLERVTGQFVYTIREIVLPLFFVLSTAFAAGRALMHSSPRWFLIVLTAMYVADRLVAAAIEYLRQRIASRRTVTDPAEEPGPVYVDSTVRDSGEAPA